MKSGDWKAYGYWRSCLRKTKYKHEGQARREAFRMKQNSYKCKHCDGWHLTSSRRRDSE